MSFRAKDDEHLITFHPWPRLNFTDIGEIVFELEQNLRAQLPVCHLAAAKPDGGFHLVTAL